MHSISKITRNTAHFNNRSKSIWDALHHLVPFVQSKKREKHPWRRVNFNKVAGTKSRNASHKCFYRLPFKKGGNFVIAYLKFPSFSFRKKNL